MAVVVSPAADADLAAALVSAAAIVSAAAFADVAEANPPAVAAVVSVAFADFTAVDSPAVVAVVSSADDDHSAPSTADLALFPPPPLCLPQISPQPILPPSRVVSAAAAWRVHLHAAASSSLRFSSR